MIIYYKRYWTELPIKSLNELRINTDKNHQLKPRAADIPLNVVNKNAANDFLLFIERANPS